MKRILGSLLAVSCAVTALGCAPTAEEDASSENRPNVLLVVLDTTRADALSCYGCPQPTTPAIDAIASEGTLYRQAYATSFWTLPSHGSLFTGLYPTEAGATSETNHLPGRALTIAEQLAAAGYRTGAVVRNAWVSSERGFAQGFGDYVEAWRGDDDRPDAEAEEAAVDTAVQWIDANAADDLQPFFLFVNINIAHFPYTPPEAVWRRFSTASVSSEREAVLRSISGGWGHLAGALTLDDTDFKVLRGLYLGEVAVADTLVDRLVTALETQDLLDDTLVIITSDHGENLGEHGLIDHVYSMYDTTIRVPLIIRYPARFTPGATDDDLVSLVDIAPTILDLCEGRNHPVRALPGRSLCDPLRSPLTAVYAENGRPVKGLKVLEHWFPDFDRTTIDHPMRMVRSGTDKLIWKVGVSAELYDLETDPEESIDRSTAAIELRNGLLADLREWTTGLTPPPTAEQFTSSDEESLSRLRALGYVD